VSTNQRIGFGKKIRWDWFLLALRLRAKEVSFEDAREELEHLIAQTNAGKVAIAKSMSVLRQAIFLPAPSCKNFSDAGFDLFRRYGDSVALPVIWGLSISGYSFFASCADTVGRLLKLHAEFTAAEMQRRLTEREGDRAFVIRIARFNLSSMLDWGLLEYDAGAKRYQRGKVRRKTEPRFQTGQQLAGKRMILPGEIPNHPIVPETAVIDFIPVLVIDGHELRLIGGQYTKLARELELWAEVLPQ
jgi:hypothetical protein